MQYNKLRSRALEAIVLEIGDVYEKFETIEEAREGVRDSLSESFYEVGVYNCRKKLEEAGVDIFEALKEIKEEFGECDIVDYEKLYNWMVIDEIGELVHEIDECYFASIVKEEEYV